MSMNRPRVEPVAIVALVVLLVSAWLSELIFALAMAATIGLASIHVGKQGFHQSGYSWTGWQVRGTLAQLMGGTAIAGGTLLILFVLLLTAANLGFVPHPWIP